MESFFEGNPDKARQALENEKTIDFLYHGISSKLVRINNMTLSKQNAEKISKMFSIISDIERIGDHAENICEYTLYNDEYDLKLSEAAEEELKMLSDTVDELIENALSVYELEDAMMLSIVEPLEKKVDKYAVDFTDNHIERLKSDICDPRAGVIFTDLIIALERSADHA
jgi:phosphate:Na+ symporter